VCPWTLPGDRKLGHPDGDFGLLPRTVCFHIRDSVTNTVRHARRHADRATRHYGVIPVLGPKARVRVTFSQSDGIRDAVKMLR
jgi:hypothetical protein